jgi:pantoate--beta-alanine ligase
VKVDYLAVIDPATFTAPAAATDESAAIVAARLGTTRLIDNMQLGPDDQD